MQSTPQGGLRDRQAARGEAASRARRPCRSKQCGGYGARMWGPPETRSLGSRGPWRAPPAQRILWRSALGLPANETHPAALASVWDGSALSPLGPNETGRSRVKAGTSRHGAGPVPGCGGPVKGSPPRPRPGLTPAGRRLASIPPGVGGGGGPVLKHGPRSAACMQGERIPIPKYRNEHNHRGQRPGLDRRGPGPSPPARSTPPGTAGALAPAPPR